MHQMITGGFETTTGALAKGMWLLISHPDQHGSATRRSRS